MSENRVLGPRVIVALDYPNAAEALAMAQRLSPDLCRLKVGFELFVSAGPSLIEKLQDQGFDVFCDLKFHDIPNTVASACRAAARMGVWMVNVHASGGPAMLEAARTAIDECTHKPLLIGVTVLTSMDDTDLHAAGLARSASAQAGFLADWAAKAGLDGVVCSAQEAAGMHAAHGRQFLTVTPGIRPINATADDQKRIVTPAQAVANGSDYLVIGRPITRAVRPLDVLSSINDELKQVI